MVYTGKPSRGCGVCRKRRIKCDEKSGSCSYCEKTNQQCPGYKNEFDLAWRDQRNTAKSHVERRTKATESKRRKEDATVFPDTAMVTSSVQTKHYRALSPSTQPEVPGSIEDFSNCFFFNTYARPTDKSAERYSFMEFIQPMYETTKPGSMLHNSTLALSTLMFNAWQNKPPDNPLSRSFYLQGLSSVKGGLEREKTSTSTELLLSVMLLQFYECVTLSTDNDVHRLQSRALISTARWRSELSRAHLAGALALVRLRGPDHFNDPIAQAVLMDIRKQLIENSFTTSQPLAEDISDWAETGEQDDIPATYTLDTINLDVANLHALIFNSAISSPVGAQVSTWDLLARAQALEARLHAWASELPTEWFPIRISGPEPIPISIRQAGLYQDYCDVYSSVPVAGTWNKQRTSLIRTQVMILTIISTLAYPRTPPEKSIDAQSLQIGCHAKIQQLADDICASVPFHLGDRREPGGLGDRSVQYPTAFGSELRERHYLIAPAVGGFELLKCLPYLMSAGLQLRKGQKQWIAGQLGRIKMLYNLGRGRES